MKQGNNYSPEVVMKVLFFQNCLLEPLEYHAFGCFWWFDDQRDSRQLGCQPSSLSILPIGIPAQAFKGEMASVS